MKKLHRNLLGTLLFNILLISSVSAAGVYSIVGRSNDPFVFCTKGVPLHNWTPVNPSRGTWRCLTSCKYVNYQWISTYTSICPAAFSTGSWKGPGTGAAFRAMPGSGALIPYIH